MSEMKSTTIERRRGESKQSHRNRVIVSLEYLASWGHDATATEQRRGRRIKRTVITSAGADLLG